MKAIDLEKLLPYVSKPSRYLGREVNAVRKDPSAVRTTVALAFPDTYEIGMSHLGLQILYRTLNDRPDTAAERVFAPWLDMEAQLRKRGWPLHSLESGRPLHAFDLVGFSLQYELSYTNLLNMLDLGGIPLHSDERGERDPLVLAGGPGAFNPEPLADFLDAVLLGDGEEAVHEIVETHQAWKGSGSSRAALLRALARIPGVYVPSLVRVDDHPDGRIRALAGLNGRPARIKKRVVLDLDRSPYPKAPVIPYMQIVHDRSVIEVARGCPWWCRFCQAGVLYAPLRERSPEKILELAERAIRNTGHEEISLASLSTGDYGGFSSLVGRVMARYGHERISVSLPSLRVNTVTPEVMEAIRTVRKTGFTIAPEAATPRLRAVISKGLDEGEVEETVWHIFAEGWDTVKLYFMVGLPTETQEDVEGIARMARRVQEIGRKAGGRGKQVNVGVSTFVPKPHTPFQWIGQIPLEEVRARQGFLRRALRRPGLFYKGHDPEVSFLEAVFSRGDRRLGPAIEQAWREGARFDGWSECFDLARWLRAFESAGLDPSYYAHRTIPREEVLPWDHLDSGVTKRFLLKELDKALSLEESLDCRDGACIQCGAAKRWVGCDPRTGVLGNPEGNPPRQPSGREGATAPTKPIAPPAVHPAVVRIRCAYTKLGPLRFLSHLELKTVLLRALSRAAVPVAYTAGFNPHPKVAFGPALPVGVEGAAEQMDVECWKSPGPPEDLVARLNRTLPEGVQFFEARFLPLHAPSLSQVLRRHHYTVTLPDDLAGGVSGLGEAVAALLARPSIPVRRLTEKGEQAIELRPFLVSLEVRESDPCTLAVTLQDYEGRSARVAEVLQALLNRSPEEVLACRIRRELSDEGAEHMDNSRIPALHLTGSG
ncbi:MAG: TIGR03960 family B12-binding radical SAM protein [Nitrospirae bacterium]|nr:TIGR03960 family B12-binding radical SAM protein [Nitrospirota bacterium]